MAASYMKLPGKIDNTIGEEKTLCLNFENDTSDFTYMLDIYMFICSEKVVCMLKNELYKIWVVISFSSFIEYIKSLRILTAKRLNYQL